MARGRKPVIVRKLSRDWAIGYAESEPSQEEAEMEILDQDGKILRIGWEQIKWVCYLRDLGASVVDPANPERLLQKKFRSRPRTAGVWLRLTLADHDQLEGIVTNDLSLIKSGGLLLTPPDTRSNTQRIFVPHQAIEALEVVGVIGVGGSKRHTATSDLEQPSLFPAEPGNEVATEAEPRPPDPAS